MKSLFLCLCTLPAFLYGQGNVGINTTAPDHPFQVNVDSIWTDTIEDYYDPFHIAFTLGLAIVPGSQKGAQRFPVAQTGFLSSIKFYFALPTNATEVLIEVFRGAGPEGVLMTSGNLYNVTIGAATLFFAQPWSWVEEGDTLNVVMTPISGASCKWRQGLYALPDIPPYLAFHYTGSWDTIAHSLALATYITFNDTVFHQVLNVRDDRRVMINDYILPRYDGAAGDVLQTNGSGNVTWLPQDQISGAHVITDGDGDTKVDVEQMADEDIIRFKTNGIEKMTIRPDGNVGIATGNPTAKLHVHNGSALFTGPGEPLFTPPPPPVSGGGMRMMWYPEKAAFRVGRAGGTEWDRDSIGNYSFAAGAFNKAKGAASFVAAGTSNSSSGNESFIGAGFDNINTASSAFIGAGTVNTTSGNYSFIGAGAGNIATGQKSFIGAGEGLLAKSHAESVFGSYSTDYVPSSTSSFIGTDRLFVIGNGTSFAARSNALTILKNGSIGIATSSPETRLHIEGSTTSSQNILSARSNYSGNVQIKAVEGLSVPANGYGIGGYFSGGAKGIESIGNGGSFSGTVTAIEGTATGTSGTRIGLFGKAMGGSTNWAGFFADGNVYVTNQLRIGQDAQVGTSGYKLLVDGKIIAEEVRVQLSEAWPDYVFADDYPLPTLEEVEAHIRSEKHLQGIPSASEVQANGLLLGDMQQKMMQKMEELMLYILQQDKRIDQLEQYIKDLQGKTN